MLKHPYSRNKTLTNPLQGLPVGFHHAKRLAGLLDTAFTIPVINKKIGLDPLLSFIPFGGSVVGGLLSLYVLWLAIQLKLPNQIMLQMLMNILIDVTIGEIPFVGAVVDAMWRSNTRNIALVEKAHREHNAIRVL
jgi:hypothetical protein